MERARSKDVMGAFRGDLSLVSPDGLRRGRAAGAKIVLEALADWAKHRGVDRPPVIVAYPNEHEGGRSWLVLDASHVVPDQPIEWTRVP